MATHSSNLAWRISWAEEPGGLQSIVRKELDATVVTQHTPTTNTTFLSSQAQLVKNLPAGQETQVQSLDWEDPLEKEMATHYSILAWKIPWSI